MAQNTSFRVLSIGDLAADLIVPLVNLPLYVGEDQVVEQILVEPGGAGNFLILGARLGMQMQSLAAVGQDIFGSAILALLQQEGVDVSTVVSQAGGKTTTVLVLVDQQGRHVFLGQFGTGAAVPFSDVWQAAIQKADALHTWGYTLGETCLKSAMLDAIQYAHSHNIPVFFDPGPQMPVLAPQECRELLAACHGIFLTEAEIPALSGGVYGKDGVQRLLQEGADMVCIKKGMAGCEIISAKGSISRPGFSVTVRDTTAAGDTFAAGFIYAYLNAWPLTDVAEFANAVGAAKVQKMGSGRQVPTLLEIQAILQKYHSTLSSRLK